MTIKSRNKTNLEIERERNQFLFDNGRINEIRIRYDTFDPTDPVHTTGVRRLLAQLRHGLKYQ